MSSPTMSASLSPTITRPDQAVMVPQAVNRSETYAIDAAGPGARLALWRQGLRPTPTPIDQITVVIQRFAEDYFAAMEDTANQFGEGDTAAEALDDLLVSLREYREDLQASDSVLLPHQKQHLSYLVSLKVL